MQNNNLSHSDLLTNESTSDEVIDPKEEYERLLNRKYRRIRNHNAITFNDILFDLAYDGYVSQDRLEKTIESSRKEYIAKEGTEESKLVNKIIDWTQIPDNEFENVVKTIKDKVSLGKFDVFDLLKIYAAFIHIETMKINDFILSDNDTEIFKSAINSAMRIQKYSPSFETRVLIWSNYDIPVRSIDDEEAKIRADAEAKYNNMRQYALSINEKHREEEYLATKNSLLALIKDNETEKFRDIISNTNIKIILIDIPPKDLINAVILANARTKQIFLWGLESLFPEYPSMPSKKEIDYLVEIKSELDNYLNKQLIRKNSISNLYYAQSYINNIINNYLYPGVIINTKG